MVLKFYSLSMNVNSNDVLVFRFLLAVGRKPGQMSAFKKKAEFSILTSRFEEYQYMKANIFFYLSFISRQ